MARRKIPSASSALSDTTVVLRRVPKYHVDRRGDCIALSKNAFRPRARDKGRTSVNILKAPEDKRDVMKGHSDFGLVSISVGAVRECGLNVLPARTKGNPTHAVIVGDFTPEQCKFLA